MYYSCLFPHLFNDKGDNLSLYNAIVAIILFITLLFANFAESVAEGRGKAQAETLKKTKKDTKARLIHEDGSEEMISASELKKGDVVLVKAGELIPNDGEIIEGIASIDESAITGESAPVTKESGEILLQSLEEQRLFQTGLKWKLLLNQGIHSWIK